MAKDDILRKASKKLGDMVSDNEKSRLQPEQDRRDFISTLSKEMVNTLSPLIAGLTMQSKVDSTNILKAIASIQVNVPPIASPQVKLPTINVPTPKVNVQVPQIKVPQINVPKTTINFPDSMDVGLGGFNSKKPMPVMMFDGKGRPQSFSMGAGGGGKADFLTIKNIITSSGASVINDAGQLKTDAGTPTLSLDYGNDIGDPGETGAETVRMVMATDAIASVNIVSGSASGTEYTDGATASPPDGAVIMGNTGEESGNIFAVALGSGAISSNSVRVVQATDAVSSVNVTGFTASVATNLVNTEDVAYDSDNPLPISGTLAGITADVSIDDGGNSITVDGTVTANPASGTIDTVTTVTGITNSVAAGIVDSSGVQYSGSNPVPTTEANSTAILADTASMDTSLNIIDDWDNTHSASVGSDGALIMGKAVTSNPSAVSDGDATRIHTDKVGRQLARPVQVREMLATAFAAVITGTETTLLTGATSIYHDLVWVLGANHSDAAVQVDIRSTVGGNILLSLDIPANSTAGIAPPVPYPAADVGATWTVDLGDDTQDCDITALFSKEV